MWEFSVEGRERETETGGGEGNQEVVVPALVLEIEVPIDKFPGRRERRCSSGEVSAGASSGAQCAQKGLSGGFCVGARRLCRGCISGLGVDPPAGSRGSFARAAL